MPLDLGVRIAPGHCPLVPYDDPNEETRQHVCRESVAAGRAAERMDAAVLVCHFHNQPPAEITCREMLDQLEGCNVRIATENGINLTPYAEFVGAFATDRLGITIDIGHTRVPAEDWLNRFTAPGRAKAIVEDTVGRRLYHIHLHDYHNNEDHRPPWEGEIEWGDLFALLAAIDYQGALMFESLPVQSPADTLAKVGAFPGGVRQAVWIGRPSTLVRRMAALPTIARNILNCLWNIAAVNGRQMFKEI